MFNVVGLAERCNQKPVKGMCLCLTLQINEKASDEVLEVEKKYNEIRKPVYDKRNDIIKSIPDFWLTAVSTLRFIDSSVVASSIDLTVLLTIPLKTSF